MKTTPVMIKNRLLSIIKEMAATPWLFAKDPERDFSRKRKLGLENLLLLLLGMGGGTIQSELLEFNGYALHTATASSFVQQREKLLPLAFEYILHQLTIRPAETKCYDGYRLFAKDGCDFLIPTNPGEPENYFQNHPGERGFSMLHLNALYDLCNHIYVDALIQNRRCANEHKALVAMVDRSPISGKVILLADRGYESYNNLAHIEQKGWNYLIRIKDFSGRGILSGIKPPAAPEFDIQVNRALTFRKTKEVTADPALYKRMSNKASFDFLDPGEAGFYPISFRIVRFKLSNGCYEVLITNLNPEGFPPQKLKKLYHMRWGIETSFRTLKHTVGAASFHSKKTECISQELFAAMIMYNFSQLIASLVAIPQKGTRYAYQINISLAIRICRYFFRSRDPAHPPDIEALLRTNTLPVREDRCFARNVRIRQAVSFNYRIT